uniref:Uncharacterized protein n=1 Tax=Anguilla anguilla TaxID=7936 RepID=A0A0E9XLI9_ANGAN
MFLVSSLVLLEYSAAFWLLNSGLWDKSCGLVSAFIHFMSDCPCL